MAIMNDQHERMINDLGSVPGDFCHHQGLAVEDAAIRARQWLDLEERVSWLERKGGDT